MTGKWDIVVHTYMGDMTSHMDYKVDGEVLTGTGEDAANGAVADIENGTFKDGEFSYQLTIKTAVGEMTNTITGKVSVPVTKHSLKGSNSASCAMRWNLSSSFRAFHPGKKDWNCCRKQGFKSLRKCTKDSQKRTPTRLNSPIGVLLYERRRPQGTPSFARFSPSLKCHPSQ